MDGSQAGIVIDLKDRAGFRSFYRQALPRVYGYLFHRCGCVPAVAEDLTQETFMAGVAQIKRGIAVEDPIPWILGIARHKLIDNYRRAERERRTLRRAYEPDPVPEDSLVWDEEHGRERALAALAALPASQSAALTLRYVDGFSVPEVAGTLARSVHATESLLARGREGFKRAYTEASHA
ncbi:MAG: RNA polymerase sigma factor [Actinomycetota bacterium]